MSTRSILVIEDGIIWHKLLARILDGAGYKTLIGATCAEGLRLAELHKPDCIISDFHLPDGDAVSVCRALKSDKNLKRIPIIIFSSDPGAETAAYAQCLANAFILKGAAAVTALPAAIEKMLRPGFPTNFRNSAG